MDDAKDPIAQLKDGDISLSNVIECIVQNKEHYRNSTPFSDQQFVKMLCTFDFSDELVKAIESIKYQFHNEIPEVCVDVDDKPLSFRRKWARLLLEKFDVVIVRRVQFGPQRYICGYSGCAYESHTLLPFEFHLKTIHNDFGHDKIPNHTEGFALLDDREFTANAVNVYSRAMLRFSNRNTERLEAKFDEVYTMMSMLSMLLKAQRNDGQINPFDE